LSTGKDGHEQKSSVLPEINVDKTRAARGWKELDPQQHLSSNADEDHGASEK
jgi:hypothetical protein